MDILFRYKDEFNEDINAWDVGGFMADLAGRRSVLFPKIQREAGKKNQRYEIFGEESSLCEVLVW